MMSYLTIIQRMGKNADFPTAREKAPNVRFLSLKNDGTDGSSERGGDLSGDVKKLAKKCYDKKECYATSKKGTCHWGNAVKAKKELFPKGLIVAELGAELEKQRHCDK